MSDIKTPYLNGHMYEFDLCWLVEKILSFESQLNQAIDLKTIHYADPIQWDITTQYAPNTVVVDPKTGTAYMSKVPVPAGILLTNTDYWTVIFNYQDIYTKIMEGVAFYNGQTDYASKALLVNDLVWYGLDLYRVTRAVEEGGKLIPGTNMVKTSIESLLSNYYGRDRTATLLNDTLNVSGDYTINTGDMAVTSDNLTIKSTVSTELDSDATITLKSADLVLNSQNPVTYRTPTELSNYFKQVPLKDPNNSIYNVLVATDESKNLAPGVPKNEITKCDITTVPTYIADTDEYTNITYASTTLKPVFSLSGEPGTALNIVDFSYQKQAELAINAAFFNTSTNALLGINIINGTIITDDNTFDYGESTPTCCLCIADDGTLSYAETSKTSATDLLNKGIKNVIQGAYPLIVNGTQFYRGSDDELNSWSAIGQKTDGSYVLMASQKNTLSCGTHKKDLIQLLLSLGCTFAYMFDGGGSVCLSTNCTNLVGANNDNEYRKLPSFIYFSSGEKDGSYMALEYSYGMEKYAHDLNVIRTNRLYGRPSVKIINRNQNYCGIDFYNNYTSEQTKPTGKIGAETGETNTLYGTVTENNNSVNVFSASTKYFKTAFGTLGYFYDMAIEPVSFTDITSGLYFIPSAKKQADMDDGDYLIMAMQNGNRVFGIACNITSPGTFYKFLMTNKQTAMYKW